MICVKLPQFKRYCTSEEIPFLKYWLSSLLREMPCVHIYFLYKIYLKMLIINKKIFFYGLISVWPFSALH